MFYSHEILTSPEHGVATIWLVATLGPRSITKKLNRKAILDVDVPKACNVIMDPAAPMALRLQGNLLYGVSKVYNQQCGYALMDVQTMHDRMKVMLRVVPGGGLDPLAGKARPDQLILPYDPSFAPENDIPGMDIDLSKWIIAFDAETNQDSDLEWPRTPDLSQSAISRNTSLQLSFSSADIMMGDLVRFGSETDVGSVQRSTDFARLAVSALGEEQGILLQPDFEFDEDGNIVELGGPHLRGEVRQQSERRLETPTIVAQGDITVDDIFGDDQLMNMNDDIVLNLEDRAHTPEADIRQSIEHQTAAEGRDEMDIRPDAAEATMRQPRRRPIQLIPLDSSTVLQNTELVNQMDKYLHNMASALEQRQQNQISLQAKENAAFWVFGKGIGSVGIGVGVTQFAHPLQLFSGEELYDNLSPLGMPKKRKRGRPAGKNGDVESESRRVRAREELEEQVGRGDDDGVINWQEEVEIGRQASVIREDSSIMPWNITASVQSSHHGSVTANIFRGLGSVSDFSSHGFGEPSGLGLQRSRLTNASPLAGRGYPPDIEGLPGFGDNELEDFDLSHYLQTELHADDYATAMPMDLDTTGSNKGKEPMRDPPLPLRERIIQSNLDQDSLNFLEFVMKKIEDLSMKSTEEDQVQADADPSIQLKGLPFSTLLPHRKTSRAVATHGLAHTLALATKGILSVRQDACTDLTTEEYGAKYDYGEIFLRLA
ncbi:Rad21/Rec8 N terminal domain protein [Aspergillus affinis]|uniref:Rad21/Rec8 N terminal domain protein n=1 Tax=Aspergillus affinis TaxID=1070780 RepID=UPI0022FDC956|nr:uncharacterized protein KD926_000047 [Aspergillus affinis]KAI9037706.1 hypothetical protein KD926_000047 [Aspergillus affinis]